MVMLRSVVLGSSSPRELGTIDDSGLAKLSRSEHAELRELHLHYKKTSYQGHGAGQGGEFAQPRGHESDMTMG